MRRQRAAGARPGPAAGQAEAYAMLDIVEIVAVREAVARQRGVRRRICELLMADHTRREICRALGISRFTLRRRMLSIRESFCKMGFDDWLLPRRAGKRSRPQVLVSTRPMAIVNPSWRGI